MPDGPEHQDVHPVLGLELQPLAVGSPHYAGDDCGAISIPLAKREVTVPGPVELQVRDLAPDPDVLEPGIVEDLLDDGGDLMDGQDLGPVLTDFLCDRPLVPGHQQLLWREWIMN